MSLLFNLHVSNPGKEEKASKTTKVDWLMDFLKHEFRAAWVPHREVSIDEAMIPFKGTY
jgi:hypothetical protein